MLYLLGAPIAYSMEAEDDKNSTAIAQEEDKYALNLMDLPEELLFAIVQKVSDTGSLKDTHSVLLTNKTLARLLFDYRNNLSKEICTAFEKDLIWHDDALRPANFPNGFNDSFKTLYPKLMRLIGRDSKVKMARTLSLLTNEDVLKLLKHICNLNAKNPNIDNRHTLIILKQLIIQAGKRKLDINFENEQGLTPLMWPTTLKSDFWLTNGHTYALYDVMLKAGADINYKNKDGKTFFDTAIPQVKSYIEEYLLEKTEEITK